VDASAQPLSVQPESLGSGCNPSLPQEAWKGPRALTSDTENLLDATGLALPLAKRGKMTLEQPVRNFVSIRHAPVSY
jgi:hypothetical protein